MITSLFFAATTYFYVLDTSYSDEVEIDKFKPSVEVSLESHVDGQISDFLFPDLPVFYLESDMGSCFYQLIQGVPNVLLKSRKPNKALMLLDDQKDGVIDKTDSLHKLVRFIEPAKINDCVGEPRITTNEYNIAIHVKGKQRINQQIDGVRVVDRVKATFIKDGDEMKGAWLYSIELKAK